MPCTYDYPFHDHALAWQVQAMQDRSSKRPRDPSQLAKLIIDIASGERSDPLLTADGKNAAAVALGRRGGLKGGLARAERLTAERRKEIAQVAAATRWKKNDR